MTKEQLLEQDMLEEFFGCDPAYYPKEEVTDIARALKIGYERAQPKWINALEQQPSNDRQVLIYVRNTETPWWSGNRLGAYINEKWYLDGGIKTSEQWNTIFNKTVIDPDGWDRSNFTYSWYEEFITEREFTNRLAHSTIKI